SSSAMPRPLDFKPASTTTILTVPWQRRWMEMIMEDSQQPVACMLGRDDLAQRQERWQALAARSAPRVSPARQGLRLTFGDGPGVAGELAALVEVERECCGFADWSLHTGPGPGQHVLDVSGGTPE